MAIKFKLNLQGIRNNSPLVLKPFGNVSILLKQRFQKLFRKSDGQLIILQDYTTVPEQRFPLIQIPTHALTSPFNCSLHLLHAFGAFALDLRLLDFLHKHVGRMSIGLSAGGLTAAFWLFADVEVVQIELVEEDAQMQIERLMKKEASRIMDEKLELRQRSFLDVDEVRLGDNNSKECAVCLEDLEKETDEKKRNTKLTMMPCSHIFHRSCICRWLEEQNSCPMCRRGIQPEDLVFCF